ncbi:N-acetylglucosamine-induced protein 1 [Elsinoe australis]|uniref:N-acetylglucosamine-induced protein 1 n=1 Tax=Elsinoe australis TaxID=40998 RepID=A0A2P8AIL8_9PEZI|nr:N-acetylglucosamine-induced protein 1 [Elsinoe australis]
MTKEDDKVPFWRVNVPKDEWPDTCPDFLLNTEDKGKRVLATKDEDYHILTWDEVETVVKDNDLDAFQRIPSDYRRYLEYTHKLKKEWGSIMNFVIQERIKWKDLTPSGQPFERAEDIRILYNDWPYGVDPSIIHLVVWTKFELDEDPVTGDLSDTGRAQIDHYVETIFRSRVSRDHVVWFKNWRGLQSVAAVVHFHVMLYRPDLAFVAELTGNDISLNEKVKQAKSS